ncbi:MAG: nucleotidyltransferase family protein [Candidatus Omnitrophota bacterium]|nr:MAG: nucleotidyltransferase family protein [Candidatus Omnitrophota bacterium]
MRILILAAGYGTRLYPLTQTTAKSLIPVNKKPIINFLTDKIIRLENNFEIEQTKVVVNNKFYEDFLEWEKGIEIKADILNDGSNTNEDRLGAIKDINFGIGGKKGDWLILGGDNIFDDDLQDFVKFALAKKPFPVIGLYDIGDIKDASKFGVVKLNPDKQIVEFQEKPANPASTLIASCVYYFPEESMSFLDEYLRSQSHVDQAGHYISWLAHQTKVFGYTLKGNWLDIGHHESLKTAEKMFR